MKVLSQKLKEEIAFRARVILSYPFLCLFIINLPKYIAEKPPSDVFFGNFFFWALFYDYNEVI